MIGSDGKKGKKDAGTDLRPLPLHLSQLHEKGTNEENVEYERKKRKRVLQPRGGT